MRVVWIVTAHNTCLIQTLAFFLSSPPLSFHSLSLSLYIYIIGIDNPITLHRYLLFIISISSTSPPFYTVLYCPLSINTLL